MKSGVCLFACCADFGVVIAPECNFDFSDPVDAFVVKHMAMGAVLPLMCSAVYMAYLFHGTLKTALCVCNRMECSPLSCCTGGLGCNNLTRLVCC
jgi:hypothetical protein